MDDTNENIKKLFRNLKEKKIPLFSGNEKLNNWIEELIEIDAYIAGIASSFIGGEKKVDRVYDLKDMINLLNEIDPKTKEELEIIFHCRSYIDLLDKIRSLIVK